MLIVMNCLYHIRRVTKSQVWSGDHLRVPGPHHLLSMWRKGMAVCQTCLHSSASTGEEVGSHTRWVRDNYICGLKMVCTASEIGFHKVYIYSTARFKLYARDYILASINTFSPSSQPMLASKDSMLASKGSILASKGSMLSSKGNMLSCMIFTRNWNWTLACDYLHASKIVQSVDALEQDYMLSCIILLAI